MAMTPEQRLAYGAAIGGITEGLTFALGGTAAQAGSFSAIGGGLFGGISAAIYPKSLPSPTPSPASTPGGEIPGVALPGIGKIGVGMLAILGGGAVLVILVVGWIITRGGRRK